MSDYDEIDEELARKFLDDPNYVNFSEATKITDEAAEILGTFDGWQWIKADGLKSLTATAPEHLLSGSQPNLSLKGLEELEEDVALQLAKHRGTVNLSGVKTASEAVIKILSKYEGNRLYLDGLINVSDDSIKVLASTSVGLGLSSLSEISDDTLELLVRSDRDFLSLGLQKISKEQSRILEFFHGENLELDSVVEISDDVAKSLTRISSSGPTIGGRTRISLAGLHDFSESVAEHLGSMAEHTLVLPGKLQISRAALDKLFGADFRHGSSELLFSGEILLPEYAPEYPGQADAYESIYTDSVINSKRMGGWLNQKKRYRSDDLRGSILTLPAAELLANGGATKILLSLQKLPDNVAEALEKYKGELSIAIDRITPFAARCLAKRKYRKNSNWNLWLYLNRLEADEAAELARTRYHLKLELDSLSDEAARLLAEYEGECLRIDIYELSDAAAKALATFKGNLDLNELKKLSDAAAESLSTFKGDLNLEGLTELSDAAAESLSKHKGDLSIQWLTLKKNCSDAAQEALYLKSGTINGQESEQLAIEQIMKKQDLIELSDAAAEILSRYQGEVMRLDKLTSLSDTAAKSLSKYVGTLSLNGLTKLSDATAESLSKHKGKISLDGLTKLSDAAAESLSKRKGKISLEGLTELSDAAAKLLSKCGGIDDFAPAIVLDRLTSLSDTAAKAISMAPMSLSFEGLTELSDAAAESLSKHKGGHLGLNGLTELSDAATESLSNHKGDGIWLWGLTELSDAAAESLSKHKGELDLSGITEISDAAAESLSKHKGELGLSSEITELSRVAAKFLSAKSGRINYEKPRTWVKSIKKKNTKSDSADEKWRKWNEARVKEEKK